MTDNIFDEYDQLCQSTSDARDSTTIRWKIESLQHQLAARDADIERLKKQLAQARRVLKMVEWKGYDIESSERACPGCDAWEYYRVHGYGYPVAVELGAEMEGDADGR